MSADCDILIQNGDIVINAGSGDFAGVDDKTAMLQDVQEEFNFTYFDDLDNPKAGTVIGNNVKSGMDEDIAVLSTEIEVVRVLKNNGLIDEQSVEASAAVNGQKITISARFKTKTGGASQVEIEI